MMRISAMIAPVLSGEDYLSTVLSIAPHVDDVVVALVGTAESPGGLPSNVSFIHVAPASHPDLFLLDTPETWAGTGIAEPCSGQHVLADFAAIKQLAWESLPGEARLWLEPYDIIEHGEFLREAAEDLKRTGVECVLMGYDYEKDNRGGVTCRLTRERLFVTTSPARWQPFVHEALSCKNAVYVSNINVARLPVTRNERVPLLLKLLRRWNLLPASGAGNLRV
jgi:hypothetical protein